MRLRDGHGPTPRGRRQFEMSGHDSWNRNILVEIFPAQGVPVKSQRDLSQVGVAGMTQKSEAIRRETEDSAIGQFQEDRSALGPHPDRQRFHFVSMFMRGGIHGAL
jgi:hypothetical protein